MLYMETIAKHNFRLFSEKVQTDYITNATPIFVHRRRLYTLRVESTSEVHYHGQNRFSLIPILKYINTSHPVMSYVLKLLFNIILHLRLDLPKVLFFHFPRLHSI